MLNSHITCRDRRRYQAVFAVLAIPLMLSIGCSIFDPCNDSRANCIKSEKISYTNNTDEVLFVHFNTEGASHLVAPGETQAIRFYLPRSSEGEEYDDGDDPVQIDFFDYRGCSALVVGSTVNKIRREHNSHFAISQADLKPPLERSDCDLTWVPHEYR